MNQQEGNEIRMSADALIALVMAEAEAREMAAMPGPEAMGAAFQPSQRFEKKMGRLLRQARWKKQKREALRAARRMFVAVTTVVTVFTCMLMPARAVREAVVSTVMNWREQFVEVVFEHEQDADSAIFLHDVELTYIPEGFSLVESANITNSRFRAEYLSPNGEWIIVRILPIHNEQALAMDDEFSTYYRLSTNEIDAIWGITKEESNTLVWEKDDFTFQISASNDLSELFIIAEGIQICASRNHG